MPLDFKSQAEVVAYLRDAAEDCRGLSISCRGRGSVLDAHYLAGRADAFSLASALIEALPSFKGEKTGAGALEAAAVKEKEKKSGRQKDPAVDERRRALGAEATEKTKAVIHAALCEGDPDA